MVRLDTYQGALTMIHRILDWVVCMSCALDLLAQPHSWMPYVQIGFRTVLYIRSLLSIDRCDYELKLNETMKGSTEGGVSFV
jgi:hypothetical protein